MGVQWQKSEIWISIPGEREASYLGLGVRPQTDETAFMLVEECLELCSKNVMGRIFIYGL